MKREGAKEIGERRGNGKWRWRGSGTGSEDEKSGELR